MLTIDARTSLPALLCSRQWAAACRVGTKWPFRWTWITASHSSSVMLTSTRSRRIPALFTRTWRSPKASTAVADQLAAALPAR